MLNVNASQMSEEMLGTHSPTMGIWYSPSHEQEAWQGELRESCRWGKLVCVSSHGIPVSTFSSKT